MTAAETVASRPTGAVPRRTGILSTLVAGLVCGCLAVVTSISVAGLLLPASLAAYLPVTAGLMLFASAVAALVAALTSGIRNVVSKIQEVPLGAMASVVAPLTATVLAHAGEREAAVTMFVALAIVTFVTGVFLLAIGYFRLGGLIRLVPYPVVGGFLAGTGWLIFEAGFALLAGRPASLAELSGLGRDPNVLLKAGAALLFVGLVAFAQKLFRRSLVLPIAIIAGILAYNLVVAVAGIPAATLRASGWLIAEPPGTALWPPFTPADLGTVDWSAILAQALGLPGVVIVTVSALLMNASGIEFATAEDVDLDRELRSVGLQNILIGFGGGGPSYPTVSLTLLAGRLGSRSRLVGVIVAGILLAALVAGQTVFSIVPTPLLGGLLIWLGGTLLVQWLVVTARRLILAEYLIILLIFAFIVFVGFTTGIGVGLLAAVALFLFQYGRVDSVRHILTGSDYQSTVQISEEWRNVLREHGDAILIVRLQGFLFFGTADRLRRTIEARMRARQADEDAFLVIDFHRVTGVDSSTAQSFMRLGRAIERRSPSIVMTGMSDGVRAALERGGIAFGGDQPFHLMGTLDEGLGWCEAELIERVAPSVAATETRDIGALLGAIVGTGDSLGRLRPHLCRIEIAAGKPLIVQGDPSDDIFFVESGHAAIETLSESGSRVRLAMFGPGAVVGEIAFYTGHPRSASVVAASPLVAWRLSRDAMQRFQAQSPEAAFQLHAGLAAILAGRLAATDRLVRFLAD